MKAINYKFLVLLAAIITSLTSCKDDETDPIVETPAVQFEISSPTTGAMYHLNDTVFVKAKITHTEELHGYEVSIINTSQNDTMVFNKHEHMDASSFDIDTYWVNQVTNHSNMKLIIDVMTDHSGTKETKEVSFHCHPM